MDYSGAVRAGDAARTADLDAVTARRTRLVYELDDARHSKVHEQRHCGVGHHVQREYRRVLYRENRHHHGHDEHHHLHARSHAALGVDLSRLFLLECREQLRPDRKQNDEDGQYQEPVYLAVRVVVEQFVHNAVVRALVEARAYLLACKPITAGLGVFVDRSVERVPIEYRAVAPRDIGRPDILYPQERRLYLVAILKLERIGEPVLCPELLNVLIVYTVIIKIEHGVLRDRRRNGLALVADDLFVDDIIFVVHRRIFFEGHILRDGVHRKPKRDEHDHRRYHRQARRKIAVALFAVELHLFLRERLFVVAVLLLDLFHRRLEPLGDLLVLVHLVPLIEIERRQDKLQQYGKNDDTPAVIADERERFEYEDMPHLVRRGHERGHARRRLAEECDYRIQKSHFMSPRGSSGTGSKPPGFQGTQRNMRLTPRNIPTITPRFLIASTM